MLNWTSFSSCSKCVWRWLLQARAVVDGLPGDIVALALPLDVQKIVEAGLIRPDWEVRPLHHHCISSQLVYLEQT